MRFPRVLTVLSLLVSSSAFATNPIDVETYLQKFHQDPKAVMNDHLATRDQYGFVLPEEQGLWPQNEQEDQLQLEKKAEIRRKICHAGPDGLCNKKKNTWADISPAEELTKLLYTREIDRSLADMDRQNLQISVVNPEPWSESYWPVHKGGMARRYADSGFPESSTWLDNYSYYLSVPPSAVATNVKAPSEKYDLLVGDGAYQLTHKLWMEGKTSYYDVYGKVPTWVGYCHGWAPASFMYSEPVKNVTAISASGQPITFHPSDIKALASLSWGEAPPTVGFIGEVCKKTNVKQDANGRILDPNCFDVNPGAWHIGLVNQLGIQKRSMVMDATWNREIWNFPISGYRYKYFNPQTLRESSNLGGAQVPISQFTIDKFKKYRSPRAAYVVGIALDVGYSAEIEPTTAEGHREQKRKVVRFLYDLELDSSGTIIGGEWYSNFHPDFVWNPFPVQQFPDRQPLSEPEKTYLQTHPTLPAWSGSEPVNADLVQMAPRASNLEQPLHVIVDKLVELSVAK